MRAAILLFSCATFLLACGDDDDGGGGSEQAEMPTNCPAGHFVYNHTLRVGDAVSGSGDFMMGNHAFVNATSAGGTGTLTLSETVGTSTVELEFQGTLASGGTAPARGFVRLEGPDYDFGNCDTGDFDSELSIDADGLGYTMRLSSLRQAPYCSGTRLEGDLAACYRQ